MTTDPYANKPLQNVPFINARERFIPPPKRLEPAVDEIISRIVGKKIFAQDPRLLKLIVKWKKGKKQNSIEPDNFLKDEKKIRELKEVLNKPL